MGEVSQDPQKSTLLRRGFRLNAEALMQFLPFTFWLVILATLSIYANHRADVKVKKINVLQEQRLELEAAHTETREKLAKLSLESRIRPKAEALGLTAPSERPKLIVVK